LYHFVRVNLTRSSYRSFRNASAKILVRFPLHLPNTRVPPTLTRVGSLRFVYDGERLSPTETPAEVCCLIHLILSSSNAHSPCGTQRSMEDGDVVDALLQQACAHFISHRLRSSSRLFRSEVARAFAHDLSMFDLEPCRLAIRQCFFFLCCTYQSLYLLPKVILWLNFVIESATLGKTVLRLIQRLYSLRLRMLT
jgi:hypothetical protein